MTSPGMVDRLTEKTKKMSPLHGRINNNNGGHNAASRLINLHLSYQHRRNMVKVVGEELK